MKRLETLQGEQVCVTGAYSMQDVAGQGQVQGWALATSTIRFILYDLQDKLPTTGYKSET